MDKDIKISVITVCLNAKNIIEDTIISVLNQKYDDFEYILIDGQSTDGTLDIITKYQDKIRFVSEPDKGIYDAMNKGIRLSKGDLLYFPNAGDQFIHPQVLSQVAGYFKSRPDTNIIYGDILLTNKSAEWISNDKTFVGEIKSMRYLFTNMFCQQRAFFHRRVFEILGEFDISYKIIADYDIITRAYLKGLSFGYLNAPIVSFPMGGYAHTHFDQFFQERFRTLNHLPWWQRYWIIDQFWGGLMRGSLKKYLITKFKSLFKSNSILN